MLLLRVSGWVLWAGRHALAGLLELEVEGGDRVHHVLHRGLPQVHLAKLASCAF